MARLIWGETMKIRQAPEGTRNVALRDGARRVARKLICYSEVPQSVWDGYEAELAAAAESIGLDKWEIHPTIKSAFTHGRARPLPPRGGVRTQEPQMTRPGRPKKVPCKEWLIQHLTIRGASPRTDAITAGKAIGHGQRTIDRAFNDIGGLSIHHGKIVVWCLPATQERLPKQTTTPTQERLPKQTERLPKQGGIVITNTLGAGNTHHELLNTRNGKRQTSEADTTNPSDSTTTDPGPPAPASRVRAVYQEWLTRQIASASMSSSPASGPTTSDTREQ